MTEDVALTPEEVAGILKIAKNTVYELIKRGELPGYRIGRKIRIDLKDVEAYRKQGKKTDGSSLQTPAQLPLRIAQPLFAEQGMTEKHFSPGRGIVICGQDNILDILTRHLERHPNGIRAFRHHVGSFTGLLALYQDSAHVAAIHLWDGDSDSYNIPYVRRLMPGTPAVVLHLACRMQGFYTAAGNPKGIKSWADLIRPEVRFVNREKGCGTRVLLDEKLRLLKLDRKSINGYQREELSHLAVASAVARNEADAGLGNEKASLLVRGLEFIPLHKERYELVIKKEDIGSPGLAALVQILRSGEFRAELAGLGDYDLTDTGKTMAEL